MLINIKCNIKCILADKNSENVKILCIKTCVYIIIYISDETHVTCVETSSYHGTKLNVPSMSMSPHVLRLCPGFTSSCHIRNHMSVHSNNKTSTEGNRKVATLGSSEEATFCSFFLSHHTNNKSSLC